MRRREDVKERGVGAEEVAPSSRRPSLIDMKQVAPATWACAVLNKASCNFITWGSVGVFCSLACT